MILKGRRNPIDAKLDFGAVGNGVADDTARLQAAINAAIAGGYELDLGAGTFKTTAELWWNDPNPRIFGRGMADTIIAPSATSYHALRVGTGTQVNEGGYLRDFGVRGPIVTPSKTSKAGVCCDAVLFCSLSRIAVDQHDIGFDFINNCYGSTGYNLRSGYGTCNVALNLRNGFQSGSDLSFYNSWLSGEVAGVHISGDGGGFHFYGGQISAGQQSSSAMVGAAVVGKDYESGTTGRSSVTFDGIDFEGYHKCAAIRTFSEVTVRVNGCAFLGTATTTERATGIVEITNALNSRFFWVGNAWTGDFSAPTLIVQLTGSTGVLFTESMWVTTPPMTINGSGTTAYALLNQAQADYGSVTAWVDGGGYITWQEAGMLLRRNWGAGYAIQHSTDWGANWTNGA